ncbi:MAG: Fic family protein [Dysgonamonadaceae bacterium]|nr:Fic family protein [Dysgonamonadaceae bacterium]
MRRIFYLFSAKLRGMASFYLESSDTKADPVLKAAIAHFWFIIIHPFDDGNGRK